MLRFVAAAAAFLSLNVAAHAAEADPDDVSSLDALVLGVYDTISGGAGEARDWDRFRSLFIDEARLIPTNPERPQGVIVWTVEDYIERAGPSLERDGFYEVEIARKTDRYGHVAQVFTTYESRRTLQDEEPFSRGINSMQAVYDGERWWMVSIFWQSESDQLTIPDAYLP